MRNRYRGYYYDREIGMYYLQSRYYDPDTGRFINADETPQITFSDVDFIHSNVFSYCVNSPATMSDENGCYGISIKNLSTLVSAFSGAYIGAAIATHFELKGWKRKLCIVGGAVLMGLVGWVFPAANLYAAIKDLLFAAGYRYLKLRKYSLAAEAYSHGMWGAGRPLPQKLQKAFIAKIKESSEYKEKKSELIRSGVRGRSITIHYTKDRDLHYSIQHIDLKLSYNRRQKNYLVFQNKVRDEHDKTYICVNTNYFSFWRMHGRRHRLGRSSSAVSYI